MNTVYLKVAAGLVLILLGVLASSEQLIWILQGIEAPDDRPLVLGTLLFKGGLVGIGTYVLLLAFMPRYTPPRADGPELAVASPAQTAIFAGLILVSIAMRLYRLDVGIWYDEMLTYVRYMPLSVGQIISTYDDANNHVLFTVLARLSLSAFGDSVWALRLPAVGFGVASIAALYYFGRRVTNTRESLLAVALMTVSYHHIWFSQNARGYTALLFFTILSSAWFMDAVRHGNPRKWLLYSAAVALGAFTHLTMGLVVFAHFAIWAAAAIRGMPYRWNGLFFGFIPVGLLTFLAYALVLPNVVGGALLNSGLQGPDSEWTNPLWALMEVVNGLQVGFAGGGVAVVAVAIFAIGLGDFLRKRTALAALFLIPTLVGFGAMTSIGYTLFPRFFFFAMGFGILIVIHGAALTGQVIGRLVRLPGRGPQWAGALLCAGIVAVSLLSLRHVYAPKQSFAAAIKLIEQQQLPGDRIVTVGIAEFPFNSYYGKDWANVTTTAELDSLGPAEGRTWLVYTMPVQAEGAYPDILARIDRNYRVVERFYGSLNGGAVIVCVEEAAAAS
ncbi:glycosyltransferase family 39 protein [Roseovarius arcticus]|uniref:glycosyltransferase family 39 protein n=1 Tax=Roseovarius arcticus TaxID=2547404 RepID=UPI00111072A0|nr:glycosyltransferase family 39 protein [Roseovarius arcticus]